MLKAVRSTSRFLKTEVAGAATHYGGIAAVAIGAVILGPPLWAVGLGAAIAGIMTAGSLVGEKRTIKNKLVPYPANTAASPNLGKIAAELYKASGLQAKEAPIYGFRLQEPAIETPEKKSPFHKLSGKIKARLQKSANLKAQMPQSTSLSMMGKPFIVISEPLLKILNDKETKAVLAHEFARAAGRHQQLGVPHGIASNVLMMLNRVSLRFAMLTTGTVGYAAMFVERGLPRMLFGIGLLWKKALKTKKREQTPKQMARHNRLNGALYFASTVIATAVLTYVSPVYLGIFLGAKGLGTAANLLNKKYNRSLAYKADREISKLDADPLALITALRKIELVKEKSIEKTYKTPLPKAGHLTKIWKQIYSSQPAPEARIKRLAEIARKQGASEDKIKKAVSGKLRVTQNNYLPPEVVKGPLIKAAV